jgi:hypothetical protein
VAGSCEHGDEHLGFIKGRAFLDWLNILVVYILASEGGLCSMELDSYKWRLRSVRRKSTNI